MKPLLPSPEYNHPEELPSELVWVQNKLSCKGGGFSFNEFPVPDHYVAAPTLSLAHGRGGRQDCHFFFGYSAKVLRGEPHEPAQWQS